MHNYLRTLVDVTFNGEDVRDDTVSPTIVRSLIAGLAGGAAWFSGLMLLFMPAQGILANREYQSEKFLRVFGEIEPLPRTAGSMWVLFVGLLIIGLFHGFAYRLVRRAMRAAAWWRKGLGFGLVSWALMVPWFEFYLPWNVMHEPLALVLLEAVLWLGVLLGVGGVAIAAVSEWQAPRSE